MKIEKVNKVDLVLTKSLIDIEIPQNSDMFRTLSKSSKLTMSYYIWDFVQFLAKINGEEIIKEKKGKGIPLSVTLCDYWMGNYLAAGDKKAGNYLTAYYNELISKKQSSGTIKNKICAIKKYVRVQRLNWNLDYFDTAKVENKRIIGLTRDEFYKFEEYFSNPRSNVANRNSLMFWIMVRTGLRVSGMLSINIEDIDLKDQSCLVLLKAKQHKQLQFLSDDLVLIIKKYLEKSKRTHGPLIINYDLNEETKGRRLNRSRVYRIFKKIGEKLGINDMHPHRFRHFVATEALEVCEGNVDMAQKMTAHESSEVFKKYVDQRNNDQLRIANLIAKTMPSRFST